MSFILRSILLRFSFALILFSCDLSFAQSKYFPHLTVDNLLLNGNTISSVNTNGDITLSPNGTGRVHLPGVTASRVPMIDAGNFIVASAVTTTELGYLSGVTSSLQSQLDAKTDESVLTTKGDLYVATAASTVSRQGVGANNTVLIADSAESTGVRWGSVSSLSNLSFSSKTANYTLTTSDDVTVFDTTSGNLTATLYTAVGNSGKVIRIKKSVTANTLTIDANGSETIDGALTFLLYFAGDVVTLVSDGANWHVVDKKLKPFSMRVFHNSAQSIGNGVGEVVQLVGSSYDEKSMFNTGTYRATIVRPGKYLITAGLSFPFAAAAGRLILEIRTASEVTTLAQSSSSTNSSGVGSVNVSDIREFAANANISLFFTNNSGGSGSISQGPQVTYLSIMEILE